MSNEDNRVRMQDILQDTIHHYSDFPRAMDKSGSCQYTDEVGNHCAVGRYMRPEFQTTGFYANNGVSVGSLAADVDTYLDSKVIGLTEKFWSDLQDIHDSDHNWGEYDEGLTGVGKVRCGSMKDRIEAGGYD
tara:strand:+ start:228 stop:623 length:396 start_codon:yes stop_codon:yes gene_type:complete